jgi:hypothetical protein
LVLVVLVVAQTIRVQMPSMETTLFLVLLLQLEAVGVQQEAVKRVVMAVRVAAEVELVLVVLVTQVVLAPQKVLVVVVQ